MLSLPVGPIDIVSTARSSRVECLPLADAYLTLQNLGLAWLLVQPGRAFKDLRTGRGMARR